MAVGSTSVEIGRRVRALRAERGMSLSELARQSAVGKGSLSEIETGRRNPTIETLYALCAPLGVPMSALIGGAPDRDTTDRMSMRTESGGMTTATLDVREFTDSTVEVFRLEFADGADHTSPAHVTGVTEHLTVVAGRLRVGLVGARRTIGAGESTSWTSDRAHRYSAIDGPAEAVVVIVTPRHGTMRA